jgi:4-carboxymuconolactone decarboxylase
MIAVLWGAGPPVAQENKMTDTNKPNTLSSVLTYDDVRAVSPALEHYTKRRLLDGLWKRPDLSPRDRSVITVSALIAHIQTIEMPFHFALALDNGVKPSELFGVDQKVLDILYLLLIYLCMTYQCLPPVAFRMISSTCSR